MNKAEATERVPRFKFDKAGGGTKSVAMCTATNTVSAKEGPRSLTNFYGIVVVLMLEPSGGQILS